MEKRPTGSTRQEAAKKLAQRSALVQLPTWLWGGNFQDLAAHLGWHLEGTEDPDTWRVRLVERKRHKAARLVELKKLAHSGNVDSKGSFSELKTLPAHSQFISLPPEQINDEFERIARMDSGIGAFLAQLTLTTTASHENDLPDLIREIMKEGLFKQLPNSVAWLLKLDTMLHHRFAVPRVLLQTEENPAMFKQKPPDGHEFRSSFGLYNDTVVGLQSYLSPLLLSLSPWVWGIPATRAGGVIIYTFGKEVPGKHAHATEPLQHFHSKGLSKKTRTKVDKRDIEETMHWWVDRLNLLFTEITDPCNFRNAHDQFEPRVQFERMLSLEQLFRNIQSISSLERDPHATRIMLMDTLDTLEGMKLLSFAEMCKLSRAEETLKIIEAELPANVAKLLLPRARAGIQALRDLQDGFFLKARMSTDGNIILPDKKGGTEQVTKEKAVAQWLRVLRNAGHGFGGRGSGGSPRDQVLLLVHDANIPPDISDLAYLYLLRLVTFPELLRRFDPSLGT
ncbi:hypothetical protein [Amycolatopsis tucumanensis]|uniref:Uncharacterized protein n=1 Tax=Amycolatopsis tucumanensis TaxID=401106 RepID=A0ABP7ITY1_9PSEU|nr:hypothetical protein [Amycolatopsis tucumanensis]MCF6424085.1 hypothetical protein [Amycolatopsis tucumanensis]